VEAALTVPGALYVSTLYWCFKILAHQGGDTCVQPLIYTNGEVGTDRSNGACGAQMAQYGSNAFESVDQWTAPTFVNDAQ